MVLEETRRVDGTRRSRSRSRDRKPAQPEKEEPRRRKRRVGWGDPNDVAGAGTSENDQQLLAQQQQLLALQQQMGNKKAREIYCGNLAAGQVSMAMLREHFNQLFYLLPEFNQKYEFLKATGAGCIQDVKISTDGTYSFVQFFTEEIAVTALEFDKHEFLGRAMRIGRPTGVVLTTPPPPPMDITPLRTMGLLPTRSSIAPSANQSATNEIIAKKQRELYVGNLVPGMSHQPEIIRELFEPACRLLPDFTDIPDPQNYLSPIKSVEFGGDGRFAFIEFVNEGIASAAMVIFNQAEIMGKRISVLRPQGYVAPVGETR